MRCARVDSLLDRYVDGTLDRAAAAAVVRHVESCRRCSQRLAEARRLAARLASAPGVALPKGFARRVMDEVYRQALRGTERGEREARRAGFYRRLGFTFMVSAGILAVSLLVPRVSYPTLIQARLSGSWQAPGGSVVQNVLVGAGRIVQGTLGEGGSSSEVHGGGAK